MTSARLVGAFLILLAIASVAAPLLADDGCDEACGSHCGDCAWCPLAADLSNDGDALSIGSAELPALPQRGLQLDTPLTSDHVPLLSL